MKNIILLITTSLIITGCANKEFERPIGWAKYEKINDSYIMTTKEKLESINNTFAIDEVKYFYKNELDGQCKNNTTIDFKEADIELICKASANTPSETTQYYYFSDGIMIKRK